MIWAAVLVLGWQRPPADEVLRSVVTHYQKLKSVMVKVIHHADFMTDVKNSTDTLSWLAPRRFEIVSDKDSIPKLECDGKKLTTYIPGLPPLSEPLNMEMGNTKSWEGRGGFLLSCILHGPLADQLLHPDKKVKVTFDYGKTIHWHEENVSEIIETITVPGASEKISYYLSGNHELLIGTEIITGQEDAWTQYTDLKENIDLPKTLGHI